jgi:hypothetical protein
MNVIHIGSNLEPSILIEVSKHFDTALILEANDRTRVKVPGATADESKKRSKNSSRKK